MPRPVQTPNRQPSNLVKPCHDTKKLAPLTPSTAPVNYAKPASDGEATTTVIHRQPYQASLFAGSPPLSAFEFSKLIDPPTSFDHSNALLGTNHIHSYTSLKRLSLQYNRHRRFNYTIDGRRNSATNRRVI